MSSWPILIAVVPSPSSSSRSRTARRFGVEILSPQEAAGARTEVSAVTAGMFGAGFTLRLARAEAEAAGGSLALRGETLVLSLPGLTGATPDHSHGANDGASAAAQDR